MVQYSSLKSLLESLSSLFKHGKMLQRKGKVGVVIESIVEKVLLKVP